VVAQNRQPARKMKLTKTKVDGLEAKAARYPVWDTELRSFCVRVSPKGQKTYAIKYRVAGEQRWHTIGRHGQPWTLDQARGEAKRLLGDVAHGGDPARKRKSDREALTVSDLLDLYIDEGAKIRAPRERPGPQGG
jgi:Arm DNA-binding domain